VAKLTGERPMEGATPDSLLALHDAGYRETAARLGSGTVLDVGCGVGDKTAQLVAPDRHVVRLGIGDDAVDWVVSSHIIEHFVNPVLHVAELARVLRDGGTAFVITPNAPADFENPFHLYLFEPEHLVSMLSLLFEEVECLGLEGDDELQADFAARRASGERILRLDPLALRKRIPRRAYVWTYQRALPLVYRALGRDRSGVGSGIDATHLFVSERITPTTPVLFAIARRPRPAAGRVSTQPRLDRAPG
jgi:ubiquinone/menaquinone biosynthesis C-methylase UbiE